jgi:hypothetical protein
VPISRIACSAASDRMMSAPRGRRFTKILAKSDRLRESQPSVDNPTMSNRLGDLARGQLMRASLCPRPGTSGAAKSTTLQTHFTFQFQGVRCQRTPK